MKIISSLLKIKEENRKLMGAFCLVLFLSTMPEIAFAADITETATNFLNLLTGTWGKIFATIAIVWQGYRCWGQGKVPKEHVILLVVGIGAVFGASSILNALT